MVAILKQKEPKSLIEYRNKKGKPKANYSNIEPNVKHDLQRSLLKEQGYVCAYCMKRIDEKEIKIEHWIPQSADPKRSLDYQNMLGVCLGTTSPKSNCDTFRGRLSVKKQILKYNPADPNHANLLKIKYYVDGEILSDDDDFSQQLSNTLNLNDEKLKMNRRTVINGVKKVLKKIADSNDGKLPKSELNRKNKNWSTRDADGKYPEYFGVAKYFLQKKIKQMTA